MVSVEMTVRSVLRPMYANDLVLMAPAKEKLDV